jgi:hypothetical protein
VAPREDEWLDQVLSVLETLNQGVVISDEDRRVIFANSMFLEMGMTDTPLQLRPLGARLCCTRSAS